MDESDARALFEEAFPLIHRVISLRANRGRQIGIDADEFRSYALYKLIESDYRILRRYRGRSSLKTYLTTVVHRLFMDFRIHCWGRWRPSQTAVGLGVLAIELEQLLARDGFSLTEAVALIRSQNPRIDPDELEALATQLPSRLPIRFEGEESLARITDDRNPAADALADGRGREVSAALGAAWRSLEAEDRLILKLHFREGLTVAKIARLLCLEQKPLYRRIERSLRCIRVHLEDSRITAELVRDLLT
ncbi:MAG: sigma-70 family RNA polymerase sigma factor [Acidobacteriota bacterium]